MRRPDRPPLGRDESVRPVIEPMHVEAPLVHQPVVERAEQKQVVERGVAAPGPVPHVMSVKPVGGGAPGEAASAVADEQRAAHRGRDGTGAPPDGQRLTGGAIDRGDDARIAAKTPRRLPRKGRVARDLAPSDARLPQAPRRPRGPRSRAGRARGPGHRPVRTPGRPSTRGASARRTVIGGFETATSHVGRPVGSPRRVPRSRPAAGCSSAWAAIAASRALRIRAAISGGNRPCRTTVPSSSCQKVSPRSRCRASARSVSFARLACRYRRANFSTCAAVPCRPMSSRYASLSAVATRVSARTLE